MRPTSHDVTFVLRCSAAAALSYALSSAVGLISPAWASISAIIVSQERLGQTGAALAWRFGGTVVGIAVAIATDGLTRTLRADVAVQIGLAVAICAALVRRWPDLKVAMWTVPIVYLSQNPGRPLFTLSYWRCFEVLIGGLIGLVVHWIADAALRCYRGRRPGARRGADPAAGGPGEAPLTGGPDPVTTPLTTMSQVLEAASAAGPPHAHRPPAGRIHAAGRAATSTRA